jgi:hypothetical protein
MPQVYHTPLKTSSHQNPTRLFSHPPLDQGRENPRQNSSRLPPPDQGGGWGRFPLFQAIFAQIIDFYIVWVYSVNRLKVVLSLKQLDEVVKKSYCLTHNNFVVSNPKERDIVHLKSFRVFPQRLFFYFLASTIESATLAGTTA